MRPCTYFLPLVYRTYFLSLFLSLRYQVVGIPKYSSEDTTLTTKNNKNEAITIPIPGGSLITINTIGLHYNRAFLCWILTSYFETILKHITGRIQILLSLRDSLEIDHATRFCLSVQVDGQSCVQVLTSNSLSQDLAHVLDASQSYLKPCLFWAYGSFFFFGFFGTEEIAILTMFISKYKIEIKEEPQFSGESFGTRNARILQSKIGLTLTCVDINLFFSSIIFED